MLQPQDEYLKGWEDIIDAVDKPDIPLCFVNSIMINDNEINIADLRRHGYDDDALRTIINETLHEADGFASTLDFMIDVEIVAFTAEQHTKKLLKNLQ